MIMSELKYLMMIEHCSISYTFFTTQNYNKLGLDVRKPFFGGREQYRRRPACASAQSDQRLCYSLIGKYNV